HPMMRSGEQPSWPAEERLWSPVLVVLSAVLATVVICALARGHAMQIPALMAALLTAMTAGQRAAEPFRKLEQRYAASTFVSDRLIWRARQRSRLRRAAPVLRRLARLSTRVGAVAFALASALAIVLTASGQMPPGSHPSLWLQALHAIGY